MCWFSAVGSARPKGSDARDRLDQVTDRLTAYHHRRARLQQRQAEAKVKREEQRRLNSVAARRGRGLQRLRELVEHYRAKRGEEMDHS